MTTLWSLPGDATWESFPKEERAGRGVAGEGGPDGAGVQGIK